MNIKKVKQLESPNIVPPVDDFDAGRRMFWEGIAYAQCTTTSMRNGWLAAEDRAVLAEYQAGGYAASDALLAVTL